MKGVQDLRPWHIYLSLLKNYHVFYCSQKAINDAFNAASKAKYEKEKVWTEPYQTWTYKYIFSFSRWWRTSWTWSSSGSSWGFSGWPTPSTKHSTTSTPTVSTSSTGRTSAQMKQSRTFSVALLLSFILLSRKHIITQLQCKYMHETSICSATSKLESVFVPVHPELEFTCSLCLAAMCILRRFSFFPEKIHSSHLNLSITMLCSEHWWSVGVSSVDA